MVPTGNILWTLSELKVWLSTLFVLWYMHACIHIRKRSCVKYLVPTQKVSYFWKMLRNYLKRFKKLDLQNESVATWVDVSGGHSLLLRSENISSHIYIYIYIYIYLFVRVKWIIGERSLWVRSYIFRRGMHVLSILFKWF